MESLRLGTRHLGILFYANVVFTEALVVGGSMPPSRSQCLHPWELYTHHMQKDSPGSPYASPITGSWQLRALLGPERERELDGFEPQLVLQVGGGQSQGVVRSGSPMFWGHWLVGPST